MFVLFRYIFRRRGLLDNVLASRTIMIHSVSSACERYKQWCSVLSPFLFRPLIQAGVFLVLLSVFWFVHWAGIISPSADLLREVLSIVKASTSQTRERKQILVRFTRASPSCHILRPLGLNRCAQTATALVFNRRRRHRHHNSNASKNKNNLPLLPPSAAAAVASTHAVVIMTSPINTLTWSLLRSSASILCRSFICSASRGTRPVGARPKVLELRSHSATLSALACPGRRRQQPLHDT